MPEYGWVTAFPESSNLKGVSHVRSTSDVPQSRSNWRCRGMVTVFCIATIRLPSASEARLLKAPLMKKGLRPLTNPLTLVACSVLKAPLMKKGLRRSKPPGVNDRVCEILKAPLMKKGLRQCRHPEQVAIGVDSESSPDEEGVETERFQANDCQIPKSSESSPDEEGVETMTTAPMRKPTVTPSESSPDEEGGDECVSFSWLQRCGNSERSPDEEGGETQQCPSQSSSVFGF